MGYLSRKTTPIALRNLAFGSISSTYANLGAVTSAPLTLLVLKNGTDQTLLFSIDGANDNFKLTAGERVQYRPSEVGIGDYFPKGIQIRVKDAGVTTSSGFASAEGLQI